VKPELKTYGKRSPILKNTAKAVKAISLRMNP